MITCKLSVPSAAYRLFHALRKALALQSPSSSACGGGGIAVASDDLGSTEQQSSPPSETASNASESSVSSEGGENGQRTSVKRSPFSFQDSHFTKRARNACGLVDENAA